MKVKSILDSSNVDLKKIVKQSLSGVNGTLKEAYVSKPKSFPQSSEFVTQKTKDAHEKLYKDYIEHSNRISAEIDSVSRSFEDVNPIHSKYRSLRIDESNALNAKWLHELFFGNAFDPNSELYMESLSFMKLQRDFGDFEAWQKDFMACAMSAGEGWAVCAYHLHLQRYVNTIVTGHSQDAMLGLYPVIVLDMWSHSYFKDYVDDKKSYVVAMMRQINWRVVEERITKAEQIGQVLK